MVKDPPSKFHTLADALQKQVDAYRKGLEEGMKPCPQHEAMLLAQPHNSVTKASYLVEAHSFERVSRYMTPRSVFLSSFSSVLPHKPHLFPPAPPS